MVAALEAGGVLGVGFVMAGSLLIAYRPTKGLFSWPAIGYALAASFFFSLNTCFDQLAVQVSTPVVSGFAMTLFAGLFLAPMAFRSGTLQFDLKKSQKLFWWRGGFELLFMVSKLVALKFLQAPYVASIRKVSLLFSVFGGRYLFHEGDFLRRIAATFLIVLGSVQIILVST